MSLKNTTAIGWNEIRYVINIIIAPFFMTLNQFLRTDKLKYTNIKLVYKNEEKNYL